MSETNQVTLTVGSKAIPVQVKQGESVRDVMERIEDEQGIPITQQRIVYAGQELDQDQRIADHKIVRSIPMCK